MYEVLRERVEFRFDAVKTIETDGCGDNALVLDNGEPIAVEYVIAAGRPGRRELADECQRLWAAFHNRAGRGRVEVPMKGTITGAGL